MPVGLMQILAERVDKTQCKLSKVIIRALQGQVVLWTRFTGAQLYTNCQLQTSTPLQVGDVELRPEQIIFGHFQGILL
jgi:hypothetical protein